MTRTTTPELDDDTRFAKDPSATENADLCAGCIACCTYVSIEIDPPRAAFEYDQWLWALHHDKVSLYVERPERWYVNFETRCNKLNEQGRCSIHGRHPVLCREYDPRSCERRFPLTDIVAWFRSAEEFETWIRDRRPSHFARLMKYRKDMPAGEPVAGRGRRAAEQNGGGAFVAIGELAASLKGTKRNGRR